MAAAEAQQKAEEATHNAEEARLDYQDLLKLQNLRDKLKREEAAADAAAHATADAAADGTAAAATEAMGSSSSSSRAIPPLDWW